MIFLAIDEMQHAGYARQGRAEAMRAAWLASTPAHPIGDDAPTPEEEHLKQVYEKGRDE
jgi:hypothetical protein